MYVSLLGLTVCKFDVNWENDSVRHAERLLLGRFAQPEQAYSGGNSMPKGSFRNAWSNLSTLLVLGRLKRLEHATREVIWRLRRPLDVSGATRTDFVMIVVVSDAAEERFGMAKGMMLRDTSSERACARVCE